MKELFVKYIKRECTKEEIQQIVSYFQDERDVVDVPTIEEVQQLLQEYPNMEDAAAGRIIKNILKSTHKVEVVKPIKKRPQFWKYAAILIIALACTYFLREIIFNNQIDNNTPIIVNNQIEHGSAKATLTLEDGTQIVLEKGSVYQSQNANSNGEEIVYNTNPSTKNHEPPTNTLTIPRGGQFFIKLSDGTKVWLNSETQLKYPVSFTDDESRQVELVYGEAYFEVSHSTEHKGSNFKVLNNNQEVEVLGTEFNIKAYGDEANIYTTLVEGKVSVSVGSLNKILKPGEQLNLNVIKKGLDISAVDVYDQISWKNGVFSFKRTSLKEIMQVLSRWYDMDVKFENDQLQSMGFSGVIGKEQNIEQIMETIRSFGVINTYEINNNKIIIK